MRNPVRRTGALGGLLSLSPLFVMLGLGLGHRLEEPLPERVRDEVQAPAAADHETTRISDRVYTFRWKNHRNMFVVTEEGVIVTDPLNSAAAEVLAGEIKKVTDLPVRYVVYSHEHWDHVLGGGVFKSAGATFVSHAECLPAFERRPHPELVMPDVTFEGRRLDLELGGITLELHHFGINHGRGMVVMLLPEEGILHIVDLVSPEAVGFRILPDFDPVEMIRTLGRIEAELEFDRIIPGHMGPVAPASAVSEERRYYQSLMDAVREAWESGVRSPTELVQQIKLPEYEDWFGYQEWLPLNVERMWAHFHMGW